MGFVYSHRTLFILGLACEDICTINSKNLREDSDSKQISKVEH